MKLEYFVPGGYTIQHGTDNDISLLEKVGYGIAIGNAVSEVKKIAFDVTLDNNNKGVEKYLIKHFLGKK